MWVVGIWGPTAKLSRTRRCRPVHQGVLHGPPDRVGRVAPADDHRPAHRGRDRLDDPAGATRARTGRHVRAGVDLVDARRSSASLTVLTRTSSLLPVHERDGGARCALTGLGAFVAIRWFLRLDGTALGSRASSARLLVVGSLGWVLADGLAAPLGEREEPVGRRGRADVARRRARGRRRTPGRAPDRPRRELRRHRRDTARTPPTAGRRPSRTSSGPACRGHGAVLRRPTSGRSRTSWRAGRPSGTERGLRRRRRRTTSTSCRRARRTTRRTRVVFVVGQFYGGTATTSMLRQAAERSLRCDGARRRGRPGHLRVDAGPALRRRPPTSSDARAGGRAGREAALAGEPPGPARRPAPHGLRVLARSCSCSSSCPG